MQPRYAPVRADTRAILRAKTLLGETYVAADARQPQRARRSPRVARLGAAQVAPSVQLDEIYRTFDPQTRAAFKSWMPGLRRRRQRARARPERRARRARSVRQRPAEAHGHAAEPERRRRALVRNTGIVFDALTRRAHQLRDLVSVARATFGATAAASNQLAAAFTALPTFEQRSQAAFRRLDDFAADTSPLLTQLAPAEVALTPTLRNLQASRPASSGCWSDSARSRRRRARGLPALDRVLGQLAPLLGALSPVLRNLNPLLTYGDLYQPELEAFFANGAATSEAALPTATEFPGSTITLHYLRALIGPLNPSTFALQSQRDGIARANAYAAPGAFNRLARGLETLDASNCARPTPGVSGPANVEVTQETLGLITALGIAGSGSNGNVAAPACQGQTAQGFAGLTSTFPHLTAAPQ